MIRAAGRDSGDAMKLSRDKINDLSHKIVSALRKSREVRLKRDPNEVRLEMVKMMTELLQTEEKVDRAARTKIRITLKALRLRERLLADRLGVAPDTVYGWTNSGLPVPQYAAAFVELLLTDQRPAASVVAAVAAGLAPLLLPPLPRQLKPPRPQPEPFRLGRSFLASIPAAAVPRVIDGPAAAHHRRVEFAGFGAAHGDSRSAGNGPCPARGTAPGARGSAR